MVLFTSSSKLLGRKYWCSVLTVIPTGAWQNYGPLEWKTHKQPRLSRLNGLQGLSEYWGPEQGEGSTVLWGFSHMAEIWKGGQIEFAIPVAHSLVRRPWEAAPNGCSYTVIYHMRPPQSMNLSGQAAASCALKIFAPSWAPVLVLALGAWVPFPPAMMLLHTNIQYFHFNPLIRQYEEADDVRSFHHTFMWSIYYFAWLFSRFYSLALIKCVLALGFFL